MEEKELNRIIIKNKLSGVCQDCIYLDKTCENVRKLCSESYVSGLKQKEFDTTMDLEQQLQAYKDREDKAIKWCYDHGQEINATDILQILNKEEL